MKGYKCISLGTGSDDNYDLYLQKAESGETIHYSELTDNARGQYDPEDHGGIYFCDTFDGLSKWINGLFDWMLVDAMEVLEVTSIGEVRERNYEDGSTALVVDSCKVRVIKDREYPKELLKTIVDYFER